MGGFFWGQGERTVPWGQIMDNEFECLVGRGVRPGHGSHFAEKCVKKDGVAIQMSLLNLIPGDDWR